MQWGGKCTIAARVIQASEVKEMQISVVFRTNNLLKMIYSSKILRQKSLGGV